MFKKILFLLQYTMFLLGEGGFGGPRSSPDVVPTKKAPSREPDHQAEFETSLDQVPKVFGYILSINLLSTQKE